MALSGAFSSWDSTEMKLKRTWRCSSASLRASRLMIS